MPIRFSLREHKNYAAYTPDYTFSKSAASVLRMTSTDPALGDGYFFIVVNRAWLNGKYLRFNWRSVLLETTIACDVRIYDGAYDRSSDVDFPSGAGLLAKGNGLLQTIVTHSSPFAYETIDVQANVAAGSETDCTIFVKIHDNQGSLTGSVDLDWFEINSAAGGAGPFYDEQFTDAINMERTGTSGDYGYISTGTVNPWSLTELSAGFEVGQGSSPLFAKFDVGQATEELAAGFLVVNTDSADLAATFAARNDGMLSLPAAINITHPGDLLAKFRVERVYDLRGTAGIAFYWWGAANPPEAQNQLRLETPTGFWYTNFVDGPASFRYVFIPWGSFIWVSAPQRRLEPHRHGFNEPDKSQVNGILYSITTAGVRRIDYIHAPFMSPFPCKFIVRQSTSTDFPAGFAIRRSASQNLPAGFTIRQPASQNLSSGFLVNQSGEELPSAFDLSTLEISLREHKSSASYNPGWSFSKPSASIVRATSTYSGIGNSYIFFTVSKEYIHGKYIRITWEGDYTTSSWGSRVYVYDGSYDRQSEFDFPAGSGLLLKGNGLLQTGLSQTGDFGPVTEEFQVDVSGSALENVTIMVVSGDSWNTQSGWIQVDLLEINSAAAGVGTLWREPFNTDITMDRLGTTGDYGYISAGRPPLGAVQDLAAGFTVRQGTQDLAASFDAQVSLDLPAEFTVRQPASADLLGGFLIRQEIQGLPAELVVRQVADQNLLGAINVVHFTDLPAELTVRHPASADLLGGFLIRQETEDLLAKFTIRQDFEDLPAKLGVIFTDTEDFEDATLIPNYQLYQGNGYRDTAFARTGAWSWRTKNNQNDIFDLSAGRTLSYAKVEGYWFAGNLTRSLELLDSDLNTLAITSWSSSPGTFTYRTVEVTGPVKYLRITTQLGANTGLWSDDITVTLA